MMPTIANYTSYSSIWSATKTDQSVKNDKWAVTIRGKYPTV